MVKNENKKLMCIIESAPPGFVFTNVWLKQHDVSAKLAWWYVRSGLLERIGTKAYKKAGDTITWVGAVAAMQNQMNLPVHVGGVAALQLLGWVKVTSIFSISRITLFADLGTRLPSWLNNNKWHVNFEIHRTSLFSDRMLGMAEKKIEGINIYSSCPERAAMEMLFLAPKCHALFDVTEVMEKLKPFQTDTMQLLLENCNSIKVKRFFLYFVNRFRRGLISKLDLTKINLGSGKRVIGQGGKYRYHPKYKLSLPEKIDEPD
jgi:hypothetical protein